MDLNSLYLLVTDAILRADALSENGAPGAASAHLDVSLLEEKIAGFLPPSVPEGAIARRGAVRAAVNGGDVQRAHRLYDRYSNDPATADDLRIELLALLVAVPPNPAHEAQRLLFKLQVVTQALKELQSTVAQGSDPSVESALDGIVSVSEDISRRLNDHAADLEDALSQLGGQVAELAATLREQRSR